MRVFVTGASGWMGSAILPELIAAGHQVIGLARSSASASAISAMGAEVHLGDLSDLESLKAGAAKADGVIHLAFIHDFSIYAQAAETDRLAIEALGNALAESGKPFVVTSGTMMLPRGMLATEETLPDMTNPMTSLRGKNEAVALAFASRGVRVSVVRLPPTVHGENDKGFALRTAELAREKGVSAYVEGQHRWCAVHRLDAARAFKLALEKGAAGSVYHVVGEEGVTTQEIAEAIGRQLHVPVVSKSAEEAQAHFGFLVFLMGADNPASSKQTQERLGWHPSHAGLIEDIEQGYYSK
ncbi:NAD-dependent epimerase/dehydratase [Hyaloscypha hepaticicola]|uniref:NAD-dependent epimerase/dehydratase n=1 Tax=Hyaloscypha hepaticicola TaxID=2082293 RepID=A0A2J6PW90_9HELO|nr:NAD-dependent epimerase/dehydratase [Hyaloscypha hepaticicola]